MKPQPTFRLHPIVEANLARYMHEQPQVTEYYRRMVKENPEHAVKTIMCRKMVQQDELRDLATRLKPLVEQWIAKTPRLHQQIMEKIKNVKPLYADITYVDVALAAKEKLDSSSPRNNVRKGFSI